MFCSNCGSKLDDGVKFCSNCGTPIGQPPEAIQEEITEQSYPVIMRNYSGIDVDAFKIAYETDLFIDHGAISAGRLKTGQLLQEAGVSKWKQGWSIEKMLTDAELKEAVSRIKVMEGDERYDDQLRCPRCHSTQVHIDKKGYSLTKGLVGGVLTGGIGLIAGMHGKNKLKAHCTKCGHDWSV